MILGCRLGRVDLLYIGYSYSGGGSRIRGYGCSVRSGSLLVKLNVFFRGICLYF